MNNAAQSNVVITVGRTTVTVGRAADGSWFASWEGSGLTESYTSSFDSYELVAWLRRQGGPARQRSQFLRARENAIARLGEITHYAEHR